jgi:hypothetical protein
MEEINTKNIWKACFDWQGVNYREFEDCTFKIVISPLVILPTIPYGLCFIDYNLSANPNRSNKTVQFTNCKLMGSFS